MLLIFLGSLFSMLFIGLPVAIAMLASASIMIFIMGIYDHQILAEYFINGANNFPLMAIPFFMLTGAIMEKGGISARIVNFAMSLVGHIKGGLGFVVIISGVIFAGLSGSAIADTAALGAILIPMMLSKNYTRKDSVGIICAVGIIALVIPPSIPMIVYGVISGVSITKLFIGGAVPGFLMATGLWLVWKYKFRNTKIETYAKQTAKARWTAFKDAFWALMLPLIIIVGLRGGIFTPTEAGVVAAMYATLVSVIYRELPFNKIGEIFIGTIKTTGIVMFVAAAAMVSAYAITVAQIPTEIVGVLSGISDSPTLVLLCIMAFLLIVGCVMDLTPAILIFTPVLMPVVISYGIDPIYFGILMVINLSIGLITPPIGTVLYVGLSVVNRNLAKDKKMNITELSYGVSPFLAVHVFVLLLLVLFPEIVTLPIQWLG